MKFIPLIWAGMWRKKLRTVLTLLSIVTAFALFGILQGVHESFDGMIESQHLDRLMVFSRDNNVPLPVSYLTQIAAVPGVARVTMLTGVSGYYQDQKNFVQVYGNEIDAMARIFPELAITPEHVQAMQRTRTGALVGDKIAKQFGWKVGDQITVISAPAWNWVYDIVGIVKSGDSASIFDFGNRIIANFTYLNEFRGESYARKDLVFGFYVLLDDVKNMTKVGAAIDALFANSPAATETSSEKDFAQSVMKQVGNIALILDAIVGAVFFTLLFLTGVTMRQSVADRIGELAVLKTLGFTDAGAFGLILAEALMLCVFGAAVGLVLAWGLFPFLPTGPNGSTSAMAPVVILLGLGIAVILSLISGLLPALRARRLTIVEALAGK